MMSTTIEKLWGLLRLESTGAQRRVDAMHPLELYADFEQPDRPGLVLFCSLLPSESPSLKAIGIERRQRQDGRWSLRIYLEEPQLLPVFAELCRDIIEFTRNGIDSARASGAVLSRIERWRTLMQAQSPSLSHSELRGLIGELLVLKTELLSELGPDDAIAAWTGPLGTAQDFQLPSGVRIEVKALHRDSDRVMINGLGQLDAGVDPLQLAIVRLDDTGKEARGAITATSLIAGLREDIAEAPAALQSFETLLRFARWDDSINTDSVTVRMVRIDHHVITPTFPRLTKSSVPSGVIEASYIITLPPQQADP